MKTSINIKAMENLLKIGLEMIHASQGAFLSIDAEHQCLTFEVVALRNGLLPVLGEISGKLLGQHLKIGDGIVGRAASLSAKQVASRNKCDALTHISGDGYPNAVMAIPVFKDGEIAGVLSAVLFDRDKYFTEEDACKYELLSIVASELISKEESK